MPATKSHATSVHRALTCGLLSLGFALTPEAFAQSKITKQKACKAQVEGLQKATMGQAVNVTLPDGKKLTGKLSLVKGTRGVADVVPEAGGQCPNLVGATVELAGTKPAAPAKGAKPTKAGATTAAPTDAGAPPATEKSTPMFGVTTFMGWSSITLKRPEGSSASLPYGGLDLGGGARYYLALNPKLTIPIELGISRFSNSVKVQSLDNATQAVSDYSITFSSMMLRFSSGTGYQAIPGLRVMAMPFFDFGLSSNLTYGGKHGRETPVRKLKSAMRYGSTVGLEYAAFKGLVVGAEGSFFLGSVAEAAKDPVLTGTSFSLMGYGAAIRLGYDF